MRCQIKKEMDQEIKNPGYRDRGALAEGAEWEAGLPRVQAGVVYARVADKKVATIWESPAITQNVQIVARIWLGNEISH